MDAGYEHENTEFIQELYYAQIRSLTLKESGVKA